MDAGNIPEKIAFAAAEAALLARFGIGADAFLPLFFSLRFGGDWSYKAESIATVSVVVKTTVYDEESGLRLLPGRDLPSGQSGAATPRGNGTPA